MSEPARSGDAMLHPVVLASILLLVVNDHVLKHAFPGFVTGKLSDVAGLVFFPVLLWSVVELAIVRRALSFEACVVVVVVVGATFAAMKTSERAADLWRFAIGVLQMPVRGSFTPARFVCDPTDLCALPALLAPVAIAHRRSTKRSRRNG